MMTAEEKKQIDAEVQDAADSVNPSSANAKDLALAYFDAKFPEYPKYQHKYDAIEKQLEVLKHERDKTWKYYISLSFHLPINYRDRFAKISHWYFSQYFWIFIGPFLGVALMYFGAKQALFTSQYHSLSAFASGSMCVIAFLIVPLMYFAFVKIPIKERYKHAIVLISIGAVVIASLIYVWYFLGLLHEGPIGNNEQKVAQLGTLMSIVCVSVSAMIFIKIWKSWCKTPHSFRKNPEYPKYKKQLRSLDKKHEQLYEELRDAMQKVAYYEYAKESICHTLMERKS